MDYEDLLLLSRDSFAVKIMALWGRAHSLTIEEFSLLAKEQPEYVEAEVKRLLALGVLLPEGKLVEHARKMLLLKAKTLMEDKRSWKKTELQET